MYTVLIGRDGTQHHGIEFGFQSIFSLPLTVSVRTLCVATGSNIGQAYMKTKKGCENMSIYSLRD